MAVRWVIKMGARSMALDAGRKFVVGRSQSCQLTIDDPHLSSKHAAFTVQDDGVWIEDLKSRNGVFVNEKRIEGPKHLEHADRIRIGKHEMQVAEAEIERLAPEVRTRGRAS